MFEENLPLNISADVHQMSTLGKPHGANEQEAGKATRERGMLAKMTPAFGRAFKASRLGSPGAKNESVNA